MCNNQNAILTTNVAVVGTNLVLTIPAGSYKNCANMILRLAQDMPLTATNLMPVVIQIGDAATLYSVRQKSGHNVYATQIRTRRNYVLHVAADTGEFTFIRGILNNCNCGIVPALPTT